MQTIVDGSTQLLGIVALPAGLTVSVELGLRDRGFDAVARAARGAEAARQIIAIADGTQ